jgi:trehalose 2-sulfotransferase
MDFAAAIEGLARPERSYLVCATPRSGSTLLCRTLADLGVAGVPEEYFEARVDTGAPRRPSDHLRGANDLYLPALLGSDEPPEPPPYSALPAGETYREHLRRTFERGTTPNGVFGAKIMWTHLEDFLPLARRLPELEGAPLGVVLRSLFGDARYVWVSRRDGVRQAASLWRAIQTQAWRAGQDDAPDARPRYSFAAIDHLRHRLAGHERAWLRCFAHEGIEPLRLWYEDVAADLAGTAARVLRHIDVPLASIGELRAPTRRQADELSDEWVERYVRERDALLDRAEVTA